MKRELEILKRTATENFTDEAGENSLPKRQSKRVYHPICFFVIKRSL